MKTLKLCMFGLVLACFFACGGGGGGGGGETSPLPKASQLVYTDPVGSDYRLVKNASSGTTTLVLDLYGPTGTSAQGVAFFLTVDTTKVDWANAGGADGTYSNPGTTFDLGTAPQLYKDKVTGKNLQVGLFQKTGSVTFDADHPIVSVALSLCSGATQGGVSFSATQGKQAIALNPDGTAANITIALGTITAQ